VNDSPAFPVEYAEWFATSTVEPRLHLVGEPGYVFSWLIEGSESSALLDTGCGLADISKAVAPLTRSPVEVVNSHAHFDHVGGNGLFERCSMHESAPDRIEAGCTPELIGLFSGYARQARGDFERLLAIDRETESYLLGPEQTVRAWPASEIDQHGWRIDPPAPTRLLADGDRIDLGDRSFTVIHTPGHAIEHICLLDEAAGILFAQDQAYYGPQLLHLDGSNVSDYACSARRLADELRDSIRLICCAHCLRPTVPPCFLDELADAAETVAAGQADLVASTEVASGTLSADFGHFSFVVRSS